MSWTEAHEVAYENESTRIELWNEAQTASPEVCREIYSRCRKAFLRGKRDGEATPAMFEAACLQKMQGRTPREWAQAAAEVAFPPHWPNETR